MVIAVLAVIWLVALTPVMLRKLSERRFSNSVDSFHRQLRGMRRAYPRLAASAGDPQAVLCMASMAGTSAGAASEAIKTTRSEVPQRSSRRPTGQSARRRRVMIVLIATTLGFFLLGMIPTLRVLWDLSLLAFAVTAGYVALLIHMHRRAVEREAKVVDIQERLRHANVESAVSTVAPVGRNEHEEVDWSQDEVLGPAFGLDYDGIMAGGR